MTTLILSVGNHLATLNHRNRTLEAKGYFVKAAYSVKDAFQELVQGDFDVVLVCPLLSAPEQRCLSKLIRGFGSRIPILVADDDVELSRILCAEAGPAPPVTEVQVRASCGTLPIVPPTPRQSKPLAEYRAAP